MSHHLATLIAFSALPLLAISPLPPGPRPHLNPIYAPKCWDPHPAIRPAVFAECRDTIRHITTSTQFEPDQPLRFSINPSFHPDIQLPVTWKRPGNENCDVGLQFLPLARGSDRATLYEVQSAAMAAAMECVIKPPHMGGVVEIGWEGLMAVNVLNLAVDEGEPGEEGNNSWDRNGTLEVE
ncbi:MAG: hypothetical protein Q9207_006607 [Kuettlingeria erythrocarpa]